MTKNTSIKVKPPLKVVRKKLLDARKRVSKLASPHKDISLMLDRWVQRNFKEEGKKAGGWKPLALGGRYKKGSFDSSAKILQDTGRLRLSFTPFSNKKTAGIGSELDYAEQHEKGIGVPARRMLPISKEVRKDIFKMYSKWQDKQIKALRK